MKRKSLELAIVCLATALCTQLSQAQPSDPSPKPQAGQAKDNSVQAAAPTDPHLRFSRLKGAEVKSKLGEDLGRVEDLIMDPKAGKITFVIVGRGGLLGLGEKARPVPWQAISVDSEKDVTLNMDREKLRNAPTLKADYSDLSDAEFIGIVYKFYGVQPAAVGAAESPGGTEQGASKSQGDPTPKQP